MTRREANRRDKEADREARAREALKGVERDSEAIGRSLLARNAENARNHMMGADKNQDDPIEVWGTRIGRALSVIAFIVLALWLFDFLGRPR